MAILNRRGNNTDFNPSKLLAGEFAYVLDRKELYYCYSPGFVKKLVTSDDVNEILNSSDTAYTALQKLIADLEGNPSQVTNILNNIVLLQNNKLDKTGDTKDNITTFTEATTRTNITSGEKQSVTFGKIRKFFTDIKTLAFKDKVESSDLEATLKAYIDAKFDKANIANNVVTTASGLALDARQGKALQDQVTATNNNLAVVAISYNLENGISVSVYDTITRMSKVVYVGIKITTTVDIPIYGKIATLNNLPSSFINNQLIASSNKVFFLSGNSLFTGVSLPLGEYHISGVGILR